MALSDSSDEVRAVTKKASPRCGKKNIFYSDRKKDTVTSKKEFKINVPDKYLYRGLFLLHKTVDHV